MSINSSKKSQNDLKIERRLVINILKAWLKFQVSTMLTMLIFFKLHRKKTKMILSKIVVS